MDGWRIKDWGTMGPMVIPYLSVYPSMPQNPEAGSTARYSMEDGMDVNVKGLVITVDALV